MPTPTYAVHVDTDENELFASGEEVTSDVLAVNGLSWFRGRDQLRDLAPPRAGYVECELNNAAGSYDVGTSIAKAQLVRVRATDPTTGSVHEMARCLIDALVRHPERNQQSVGILALGTLTRVNPSRQGISTALYASITTGVAIGHLLDACGWPKNAQPYMTSLVPAGQWGLGEASGDAIDLSGNGNDGTVTIGAGARGVTALDDAGDGALAFDGADTKVEIADDSAIQNIFDGGGAISFAFNADSDGEGSVGRIVDKGGVWYLDVQDESTGLLRLNFRVGFSGTEGIWQTAADIPIATRIVGVLAYANDDVANNPTLYLWNGTTFATLTVGAGLTETSTPVGTRTTDVGSALVLGNNTGATATFDGELDEITPLASTPAAAQAAAWIARVLDAPRHLDDGETTLEWWWLDETEDPFAALRRILEVEGAGCAVYEDGTGAITFKDRHARFTESRSTMVQTTFRGATTEPLLSEPVSYDEGEPDIVNTATMTRRGRSAKSSAVVWSLGEDLTLAPGESRTVKVRDTDRVPFTAAVTPVLSTDYTVAAGALASVTLDRTSGSTATLTLTADVAGATVSGLQVRAQTVSVDSETDVPSTPAVTGTQRPPPAPWQPLAEISVNDAQDIVNGLVSFYRVPRPTVEFRVHANRSADALTACLTREIGDRVRVISTLGSIDVEAFVQQKRDRVTAGPMHVTTLGVEAAADVGAPAIVGTTEVGSETEFVWW